MSLGLGVGWEEGKVCFFEKKQQKTFATGLWRSRMGMA
jgi:hypothetical protein